MPWNMPGSGNNQKPDPWGGHKNKTPTPPDLDKFLSDLLRKLRGFFSVQRGGLPQPPSVGGRGHMAVIGGVLAVLAAIWFFSGFFIVNPAEEAVVLRFGKYAETLTPGLHWIARFIEKRYVLNVGKIYSFSLQGDFLTKSSDQVNTTDANAGADQSKNLVNVELNVMYQVSDPRAYLFHVVNPDATIQQVAASALSEEIGTMKLDEVLTTGRESLGSRVLARVRQVMANYHAGIDVTGVTLRKVQPPDKVRAAFNDVNNAEQDRKTSINKAQAYASSVMPLAHGTAAQILADAEAYNKQVVLTAQADIARYKALLTAYIESPEVTQQRMYMDAMQHIMQNTPKILVDTGATTNILSLGRATTPLAAENTAAAGGAK